MSMGTLAGLARAGRRPGVIWMDAHGDINTPATTPSGNVHGMPFAVALGLARDPFPDALRGSVEGGASALVAIRDLDPGEKANIREAGVSAITMADIDRMGMGAAMEKAIAVASRGEGIHLSLDMDSIDPDEAPGVGTPVRGGLTYREVQLAMEMLAASGKRRSPVKATVWSDVRPSRFRAFGSAPASRSARTIARSPAPASVATAECSGVKPWSREGARGSAPASSR